MESVMLSIIALAVIATGAWLGRLGIQTWHERELALIEMEQAWRESRPPQPGRAPKTPVARVGDNRPHRMRARDLYRLAISRTHSDSEAA